MKYLVKKKLTPFQRSMWRKRRKLNASKKSAEGGFKENPAKSNIEEYQPGKTRRKTAEASSSNSSRVCPE